MLSEMVAAVAALWAAVVTTWAAIASARVIIAMRKAPIDAAAINWSPDSRTSAAILGVSQDKQA
jgi:hypothetical protein